MERKTARIVEKIALDIAEKVEAMGEGEIYSDGPLARGAFEVVFRHPISFDIQGEMIEEAEAMLAQAAPNSDYEFYAGFDNGPKFFEVVLVYSGY
jgi:hypothetical protein